MKRITVRLIRFSLIISIVVGCSDASLELSNESRIQTKAQVDDLDLSEAVYHSMTESWIIPRNDPYTLTNFQSAMDRLLSGKAGVVLSKEERHELSELNPMQPSHYALRVFPKTEKEQWAIELMEDVKVAYIPFNYVPLSEDQVKLGKLNDKSKSFDEEYRYTVTYSDLVADDEKQPDETITMPVLYVVWPKDKDLPKEYDYVIDYEIFIPNYSSESCRVLHILEEEAIKLALGDIKLFQIDRGSNQTRTGTVMHYDNLLQEYVPLVNLKLRFQFGSIITDTYTDENGTFTVPTQRVAATFMHILQHPRWKITSMSSTAPHSVSWGTVGNIWSNSNDIFQGVTGSPDYYAVHPAVDFYYNGNHLLTPIYYDDGIRIRVSPDTSSDHNGQFTHTLFSEAYITIFQNNMGISNYVFGTVTHELGHFSHFRLRGTHLNYSITHKLIKESYASYVANYLCDRYYCLMGYDNLAAPQTPHTGNSYQFWVKTGSSEYSPLFTDLFDDYNQNEDNDNRNIDTINGFSHTIVQTIAEDCSSWSGVKNILDNYIGVFYTQSQYNDFIDPYDYWFSHN